MERVQKVIAMAGIASRRSAEELVREGRVKVNGAVVTELGTKVDPFKDHLKVDDRRIAVETHKVYLLLNKPGGYITSTVDPEGRPTVMDLLPRVKARVYPVGRLDYDTEGLLLLTNDGDLAHALMHPSSEVKKTYWVKVKGHVSQAEVEKVERGGISLPAGKTLPCNMRVVREFDNNAWVEVVIHEGRKRQVRLMMEKIGHPVIKLKRVGYGFLKIGGLALGACRHLAPSEVEGLHDLTSRSTQRSDGPEHRRMATQGVNKRRGTTGPDRDPASRSTQRSDGPKHRRVATQGVNKRHGTTGTDRDPASRSTQRSDGPKPRRMATQGVNKRHGTTGPDKQRRHS